MRTPLRLALGITSALVLGAITATIASGFAAPDEAPPIAAPATTTVDAPVLGPASIDGVSTLRSTENPLSVPRTLGHVSVVQPDLTDTIAAAAAGDPPPASPLPADVLAAAAAIDAGGGDTPETAGIVADASGSVGEGDPAAPGDPCADPASDPAADAAGCPSGIESAIFADTFHEPLEMWISPGAATSSAGVSVWCDGSAPTGGQLWLDVATNLPATIHARYWPASNPSDVHELDIAGVASEEAAWQAEIDATGSYTPHSYVFQHCSLLTGLAPDTDYVVSAFAIDTYGRISDPEEATFSSAGQPVAPQMFALPLGQSLLYVGVPYAGGQGEPIVRAARYATGSEPPSCADPSLPSDVEWAIAPHSVDMSPEYLRSHHYISSYGKREVGLLDVPEGTNVIVCALWYANTASFDRGVPTLYKSLLASSADTATPVFTLDSIRSVTDVAQGALYITGGTTFGSICGTWNGPVPAITGATTTPIGEVLCDRGGVWGGGSTNTFQMSTSYLKPDGNRVTSSAVIRMPSVLCTGPTCDLPPDRTYDLLLPTVTVGTGMCGSSFGSDCTPPTAETALGVATIGVHWEAGASNGATAWSVGTAIEASPSPTPPDSPQFDVFNAWIPALSTDGLTGSATLAIRTDRVANYTITVSGDCWKGSPPAPITGRAAIASGDYFTASATLPNLCPGARYSSTIELVDDAGHRTLASPTTPTVSIAPTAFENWGGGILTVPQDHLVISAHVELLHGYPLSEDWGIMGADLTVGDATWPYTARFEQTCLGSDQNNIPATFDDQTVPLTDSIHLQVYSRYVLRGLYYGHAPRSRCAWEDMSDYVARAAVDVTPTQLTRGILIQTNFYPEPYTSFRGESAPAKGILYVWVTATRVPR